MVADFAKVFPEATILITAVGDPDSRAHGANESMHLGDFAAACLAETLMLDALHSSIRRADAVTARTREGPRLKPVRPLAAPRDHRRRRGPGVTACRQRVISSGTATMSQVQHAPTPKSGQQQREIGGETCRIRPVSGMRWVYLKS